MAKTTERNHLNERNERVLKGTQNQLVSYEPERELDVPCQPIELTSTKADIARTALELVLEEEKKIDKISAKFPTSAFLAEDVSDLLNLALSFNKEPITQEILNLVKTDILNSDIETLLELITKELEVRFYSRKDKIKEQFKTSFINDIVKLHPSIDTDRMKDWLDTCLDSNMQHFDLSFNNGTDEDAPNDEHAALTISSDFTHVYQLDLEKRYDDTLLLNAINTLAVGALHCPELDFLSYYIQTEEMVDTFKDVKIETIDDFYNHPKLVATAIIETGMFDEDESEDVIMDYFMNDFAEIVLLEIQDKKKRTKGEMIAKFFTDKMEDISDISTYLHTRPTHVLITHPDTVMHQLYSMGIDGDSGVSAYALPISKAEQCIDKVYNNLLLIMSVEAYLYYSVPVNKIPNLIKDFKTKHEVTPLEIY